MAKKKLKFATDKKVSKVYRRELKKQLQLWNRLLANDNPFVVTANMITMVSVAEGTKEVIKQYTPEEWNSFTDRQKENRIYKLQREKYLELADEFKLVDEVFMPLIEQKGNK